jgi:predicted nucleic acid-binding protein
MIVLSLEFMGVEIVVSQTELQLEQLAAFARPYQLTAYDAAYLHVAETKSATMLTLDQNLIDAAKRLAIPSLRT